jgi:uncharacterized protein
MSASLKLNLSALFCGVLFAVGLVISGMTQPAKVEGFLDFAGAWDASLALVMGGAVVTVFLFNRVMARMRKPLLAAEFPVLPKSPINARLIGGSALFGIGWGLIGYCPGPALVAFGSDTFSALVFVPAMAVGIYLADSVSFAGRQEDATLGIPGALSVEGFDPR